MEFGRPAPGRPTGRRRGVEMDSGQHDRQHGQGDDVPEGVPLRAAAPLARRRRRRARRRHDRPRRRLVGRRPVARGGVAADRAGQPTAGREQSRHSGYGYSSADQTVETRTGDYVPRRSAPDTPDDAAPVWDPTAQQAQAPAHPAQSAQPQAPQHAGPATPAGVPGGTVAAGAAGAPRPGLPAAARPVPAGHAVPAARAPAQQPQHVVPQQPAQPPAATRPAPRPEDLLVRPVARWPRSRRAGAGAGG